jgi:hypothetical protein
MVSHFVGREITDYSARVTGERQNHGHTARFDVTDGFVGITQFKGDSTTVINRVLLSPTQWRALTVFLEDARRHRREVR